jgi:hypothetical protein
MSRYNLSDFINKQIEVAISIEKVRMAEKFISEKQMNFEMQYAIDLLYQALLGFENLKNTPEQHREESKLLELDDSWLNVPQSNCS